MDKIAKLLALAGSDNDAEALAALRKAKELLAAEGKDFTDLSQGVAKLPSKALQSAPVQTGHSFSTDFFADFADYMEEKEPGYKVRMASERDEKLRKDAEEREALLAKYGSLEAILEPCDREKALRGALKPWAVLADPPHERWTQSIEGVTFGIRDAPPQVRKAVEDAIPLPATITEAMNELMYWEQRDREMGLALGDYGDYALDLTCNLRFDLIRDMVEETLPVQNIQELAIRFRRYHDRGFSDYELRTSIVCDLERLVVTPVQNGHGASSVQTGRSATERREQVITILRDPETAQWSDREISRVVGVSPTTVGTIRKQMK